MPLWCLHIIRKLGELQGYPNLAGASKYSSLGQFAAKFISIPPPASVFAAYPTLRREGAQAV